MRRELRYNYISIKNMCYFLCLFWMATFVKDIAFIFILHLAVNFIWQSHLTSTLLAVEKSPEHEAGYLGSEKHISLIAYPKSELNEFQPHAGFIEMRQGENPVVQEILFSPKHKPNVFFLKCSASVTALCSFCTR